MGLANITNNILTDSGILVTNLTPTSRTLTINGTTYDLSADRSWTIATGVGGSGTTNYLPKFTGASTIGNSQVFDNGTNVGIGTATPNYLLQVGNASSGFTSVVTIGANSTSASTTNLLLQNASSSETAGTGVNINFSGVSNWLGRINAQFVGGTGTGNADMTFWTPSLGTLSEKMRLTSSGNLGLGVTPSAWWSGMKAVEAQGSSGGVFASASVNGHFLTNGYYDGTNWVYKNTGFVSYYSQTVGQHQWLTAPSGTAGNAISFTQAMTLFANGNLSLGSSVDSGFKTYIKGGSSGLLLSAGSTSSDNALFIQNAAETTTLLTIKGNGAATFSSSVTVTDELIFSGAAVNTSIKTFATNDRDRLRIRAYNEVNLNSDVLLTFTTGGSERMRITSGGNVGIGTTSPNARLTVVANDSSNPNVALRLSSTAYSGVSYPNTSLRFGSDYPNYASWNLASIDSSYTGSNWGGSLLFFTNNDSTIGNLTERMRITSGGSVLIGTTTEGFLGKLQVAGSVAITGQYNTVLPSSSFSYFDGSGQVVSSSSNASALYLDTTWNTTGNPDGIYLNVTNTASGASSKLLNLKVGSVSQFSVSKGGAIQTSDPTNGTARPWKLGDARSGTISTDSYIIVEVNGVTYSIPALNGLP